MKEKTKNFLYSIAFGIVMIILLLVFFKFAYAQENLTNGSSNQTINENAERTLEISIGKIRLPAKSGFLDYQFFSFITVRIVLILIVGFLSVFFIVTRLIHLLPLLIVFFVLVMVLMLLVFWL